MTLYYSGEDQDHNGGTKGKRQIVENHPDYVHFDDDGRLVINLDGMHREKKIETLVRCAVSAIEDSDEYDVVTEPEFEWAGGE